MYLSESIIEEDVSFDVLRWWKLNSQRFPILSRMARDVLAVPISTVTSESAFSTGGRVLDVFRSFLTLKLVEALICTQDWMRLSNNPISVEQALDDLENLETGLPHCYILFIIFLGIIITWYFLIYAFMSICKTWSNGCWSFTVLNNCLMKSSSILFQES